MSDMNYLNKVEGFNPYDRLEEYTDVDPATGEVTRRKHLPVRIQIEWFRRKYPDGRISVEPKEVNNGYFCRARVFTKFNTPEGQFLAEGYAVRSFNPALPRISPLEWSQTAAIGIALRNAGFGLEAEVLEIPSQNCAGEQEMNPVNNADDLFSGIYAPEPAPDIAVYQPQSGMVASAPVVYTNGQPMQPTPGYAPVYQQPAQPVNGYAPTGQPVNAPAQQNVNNGYVPAGQPVQQPVNGYTPAGQPMNVPAQQNANNGYTPAGQPVQQPVNGYTPAGQPVNAPAQQNVNAQPMVEQPAVAQPSGLRFADSLDPAGTNVDLRNACAKTVRSGMYKGKTLDELAIQAPDMLGWLAQKKGNEPIGQAAGYILSFAANNGGMNG